jgi:hypothetical protein
LRIWAEAGVAAADTAMFDIAMPLLETEDVRRGLPPAVGALKAGPVQRWTFKGADGSDLAAIGAEEST